MMAGLLWYRSYMDSLANTSGYYPDIHAGHADRVTELTLEAPYLVRETPAGYNQLKLMELVGGSVAWNQLCNSSSVTGTSGHKFYLKKSGVESITNTNTFTGLASGTDMVTDLTQMFGSTIADYVYSLEQATARSGIAWLKKYDLIDGAYHAYSAPTLQSVEATSHVTVGFNQFDSALEFGNINSSGSNDGTNPYYVRSKDYVKVVPSKTYCFYASTPQQFMQLYCIEYDAAKNFIARSPVLSSAVLYTTRYGTFTLNANTHYIRAFIYKNSAFTTTDDIDFCINFHGERDGEYEPYTETTNALDSSVILRGMLKTDADGNLYYDGDTYEWDGTVTRNYGTRAYQAGDESLTDAITDGTNTVYKLNTPTTESADPFTAVQTVEEGGTEEFVTGNNVPVGNVSIYRRA